MLGLELELAFVLLLETTTVTETKAHPIAKEGGVGLNIAERVFGGEERGLAY